MNYRNDIRNIAIVAYLENYIRNITYVFLTLHMMPKTGAILFTVVRLARIGSRTLTRYWTMVPYPSPFPLLRMRW